MRRAGKPYVQYRKGRWVMFMPDGIGYLMPRDWRVLR
jgi:hypothetical protein